jgi:acyl-coenzyme A thioesterase PaaI-like protein
MAPGSNGRREAVTDDLLDDDAHAVPEGYVRMDWFRGFGRQIGPLYERISTDGSYARAFLVCEHHLNGMAHCHGGMLTAFADMAFGHAISMRMPDRYWVTVRLVTDFLASAALGDWVEGSAAIMGEDGDILSVRGRIWSGEHTLMTGTGVFKVLGKRPERRRFK